VSLLQNRVVGNCRSTPECFLDDTSLRSRHRESKYMRNGRRDVHIRGRQRIVEVPTGCQSVPPNRASSFFAAVCTLVLPTRKHAFSYLVGARKYCRFGARNAARDRADVGQQKDPQRSSVTNARKLLYRWSLCVGAPMQGAGVIANSNNPSDCLYVEAAIAAISFCAHRWRPIT
jgi:hypothetical protein